VHLPKLLLSSLPFSLIGAYSDSRVRRLLLPSLGFVALVSFLAHKEWRFVVYVVPVFNIAAARGAGWMCHTPSATASNGGSKGGAKKSFKEKRTPSKSYLIFLLGVTANLLATCIFTVTSIANYPGGESLSIFNEMYAAEAKGASPLVRSAPRTFPDTINVVHVHICNLAAQTGASLFLHTHAPPHLPYYAQSSRNWTYNKTELLSAQDLSSNTAITHLIAESPSMGDEWTVVRGVSGPLRWWVDPGALRAFKKKGNVRDIWKVAGVTRAEVLWILERKDG
jgi:alpha-1,6-mannosyltransferase